MYVCIKCYERQFSNVIIYKHPGQFICPRHGELPRYNKGVVPILHIEQIGNDKEIFPMSTTPTAVVEVDEIIASQNGTGEQIDIVTGLRIIKLGDGHFATERTDLLTTAKIEAMKTMPSRAGFDRSNQGKYNYTSFNQFIEHTRSHILKAGIVITPSIFKMEREPEQNGTVWIWTAWKITHAVSGQWELLVIPSFANNQDKGFKHLSKAISYNVKDMLRIVFMVPSGDEDDPDDDSTQEEWRVKFTDLHGKYSQISVKFKSLWDWLPENVKDEFIASQAVAVEGSEVSSEA